MAIRRGPELMGVAFAGAMPQAARWMPPWSDATNLAVANNRLYAAPFRVARPIKTTDYAVRVITAAAATSARCGIYDDLFGKPDRLILEFPTTLDCSTTGLKTAAQTLYLSPGLWWTAVVCQGGAPTLKSLGNTIWHPEVGVDDPTTATLGHVFFVSAITGALPATWGATLSAGSGEAPHLYLKTAVP